MTHGNLTGKDVQARVVAYGGRHVVAQLALMDWTDLAIYVGTRVDLDTETGEVTLTREPFSLVVAKGVPSSFEMQTADLAELRGSVATKPAG